MSCQNCVLFKAVRVTPAVVPAANFAESLEAVITEAVVTELSKAAITGLSKAVAKSPTNHDESLPRKASTAQSASTRVSLYETQRDMRLSSIQRIFA